MNELFNFSILLIIFSVLLADACKKKNNTPERKKFTWAAGNRDSIVPLDKPKRDKERTDNNNSMVCFTFVTFKPET